MRTPSSCRFGGYARWRALGAVLGLAALSAGAEARCLSYEPARVTLEGTLVARQLPGPPNYRSSAQGDYPETVHFLELDEPICVSGSRSSRTNAKSHFGVPELQVVLDGVRPRRFVGERVRAQGTLFGAHMRYHRTPVVMKVTGLREAPSEPEPSE